MCEGNIDLINHFFLHCPEYYEARQTLFDNIQSIDKMLLSQNESSLTHFFTVTLNATPMLMHSFSTQQLNSYYLQEDSMDRYLMEFQMIFFFLKFIFLLLHTVHFNNNNNIVLPFFVSVTFQSTFSLSFLHPKQCLNVFYNN